MLRLLLGAGVALASYYLGREVGRTEPLRREQRQRRADVRKQEVPAEPSEGTIPGSAGPPDRPVH